MFLDDERKREYPERTHAYTGRTCKLHTGRPQPGVEPGTLSLWGDGANHHTTVQPSFMPRWHILHLTFLFSSFLFWSHFISFIRRQKQRLLITWVYWSRSLSTTKILITHWIFNWFSCCFGRHGYSSVYPSPAFLDISLTQRTWFKWVAR